MSGQLWLLFASFVVLQSDVLLILLRLEPVETILRGNILQNVRF
jgi:hypothetical protein